MPAKVDFQDLVQGGATVEVTTEEGHKFQVPLMWFLDNPDAPKPPPDPGPNTIVYSFADMPIVDAQNPSTKGTGFNDSFRKWGVRTLDNNGDKAIKRFTPGVTHTPFGANQSAMRLRMAPSPQNADVILGGMVSLEDIMAVRYGTFTQTFQIKAISQGGHFANWLLPVPVEGEPDWPPEIDLFELVNDPNKIYFNYHPSGPLRERPLTNPFDVHVAEFVWTPQTLSWIIDGELMLRAENKDFHRDMYWLASWEGGGNWSKDFNDDTVFPMAIDLSPLRYTPYSDRK